MEKCSLTLKTKSCPVDWTHCQIQIVNQFFPSGPNKSLKQILGSQFLGSENTFVKIFSAPVYKILVQNIMDQGIVTF